MLVRNVQSTSRKAILIVVALSLLIVFRGVWILDQNAHQASKNLSLIEFSESHGHFHPSSLDHLHAYAVDMADSDHLLLHLLGAFENHTPLEFVAVPFPSGQDMPRLQRPPSPLSGQTSLLYRPPKTQVQI